MIRKALIYYLLLCFTLLTPVIHAMPYYTDQTHMAYSKKVTSEKITAFKNKFLEINSSAMHLLADNDKAELHEEDLRFLKKKILCNLQESFDALKTHEFRHRFQQLQPLSDIKKTPVILKKTLNTILAVNESDTSMDKKATIMDGLTIIGIPAGLLLAFLSWIPYAIALFFQDTMPLIGLFFYAISVIMTGVGWYFIL